MDSKDINKVDVLIHQFNDLRSLCKGTQNLMINQRSEQSKELEDIKIQLKNIEHTMSKLEISINLLTENYKPKTIYKDYTAEEIYNIRYSPGMTLKKCSEMLNCSMSTIQNICVKYRQSLMEVKNNE